jgi:hypothetical protein
MYVPPFGAILNNLGIDLQEFTTAESVRVPTSLLRFLLQLALVDSDFSEDTYLAENPDVANAVRTGKIEDPRLHYLGDGYFEGRTGGGGPLDEQWYLRTYKDVADAVAKGRVASAAEHFRSVGAAELRAPNALYEPDAVEWGKAFGKAP